MAPSPFAVRTSAVCLAGQCHGISYTPDRRYTTDLENEGLVLAVQSLSLAGSSLASKALTCPPSLGTGVNGASSLVNSSRLSMQLAAEEVAGARLPYQITGYSRHGLNQAISRDGVGVAPGAILDAFNNPLSLSGQTGGRFLLTGSNAKLVVNSDGKIITTWATRTSGVRK